MLLWLFLAHHTVSFSDEYFGLLVPKAGYAAQAAGLVWLMYLALEPYVRRRWPRQIVGWNRLLDARWRDPLIGRDILIGAFVAICGMVISQLAVLVPSWLHQPPAGPYIMFFESAFFTNPHAIMAGIPSNYVLVSLCMLFLLLVLVLILRREWLGIGAFILLAVLGNLGPFVAKDDPKLDGYLVHLTVYGVLFSLLYATGVFVLFRFGLLAFATTYLFWLLHALPITTDVSAWYFGASATYTLVFAAVAVYAFVISLGNRSLVAPSWLAEE